MKRYYFDIHDGIEARDTAGTEFPSDAAARANAVQIASAYAGMPSAEPENDGAIVVDVRDDDGLLLVVRLMIAVEKVR